MKALRKHKGLRRLDDMIGAPYMYNAKQITITDYHITDGQAHIHTGGDKTIRINLSVIDKELDNFLPVEDVALREETTGILGADARRMQNLEQTLMDSIDKVKEDPAYIGQAKQISNTANTLVNITKTKMKMIKELRK